MNTGKGYGSNAEVQQKEIWLPQPFEENAIA